MRFANIQSKDKNKGEVDIQKHIRHKGNLCAISAKAAAEWVLSSILDSLYGKKIVKSFH